ncbi:MAG: hypothetical protein KAR00_03265 [Candidatus Pacebacteria bacterium]|nr:hypothetical protein [Candidatus Paceibacterota bacterium]
MPDNVFLVSTKTDLLKACKKEGVDPAYFEDCPYYPIYQTLSCSEFVSPESFRQAVERYVEEDWGNIDTAQKQKNDEARKIILASIPLRLAETVGIYFYEGLEFKISTAGATNKNGVFDGCTMISLTNPYLDSFIEFVESKPPFA